MLGMSLSNFCEIENKNVKKLYYFVMEIIEKFLYIVAVLAAFEYTWNESAISKA